MKLKKFVRRGQAMVVFALVLPFVLLPMIGGVLDLGWYYLNVSRLQNAADAAALAGAQALVAKDRAFENYYVVALAGNKLPGYTEGKPWGIYADYENVDDVKIKETLENGRFFVEQYARQNLSDTEKPTESSDWKNFSVTDGWSISSEDEDKKVNGKIYLKRDQVVEGNAYGPLYYVVSLEEKIQHFFLSGWFDDMDAPVMSVVLLLPHDKGLITPIEDLQRLKVIDNWEETEHFKNPESGKFIRGGQWNHYMAGTSNDYQAVKYSSGNVYRTESVVVKSISRDGDKNSEDNKGKATGLSSDQIVNSNQKRSDGQKTKANGNKFYEEEEVDSLNIDFQAEVRKQFTSDWDLGQPISGSYSYSQTSGDSWGIGNGDDKRILFNADFESSFRTRKPEKEADVLYTRIESDPLKKPYEDATTSVFNSVRQITLNFSSDNTAVYDSGENKGNYIYRPYFIFYAGPENIDYATDKNGVWLRHSQPVVINLNANLNAIMYMPKSPVIINGNGKAWHGFVIAKCFLKSFTEEDMTSDSYTWFYDGFNKQTRFNGGYTVNTDSYGNTVYIKPENLFDRERLNETYPNADGFTINEDGSNGQLTVYEKLPVPQYPIISFTKELYENCKTLAEYFFVTAEYINNTYTKEKYMAYSGLEESQVAMVTFPEELETLRNANGVISYDSGHNYGNFNTVTLPDDTQDNDTDTDSDSETPKTKSVTVTIPVPNDPKILLDRDPDPDALTKDNKYVKVMLGDTPKYIAKSYLPHIRVKWNAVYPYVCLYDLKTGLSWNIEDALVCVKPMDNTTDISDSAIVFTNSKKMYSQVKKDIIKI